MQSTFLSFDDWFIGTTVVNRGVPCDHYKYTPNLITMI